MLLATALLILAGAPCAAPGEEGRPPARKGTAGSSRRSLSAAQKKEFDKVAALVAQGAPLPEIRAGWVDTLRRLEDVDAGIAAGHVVSEARAVAYRRAEQAKRRAQRIESYYYPLDDEVRWILARYKAALARARAGEPLEPLRRYRVIASPGDLSWRMSIQKRPFASVEELGDTVRALENLLAEAERMNKTARADLDEALGMQKRTEEALAALPAFLEESAASAVRKGP